MKKLYALLVILIIIYIGINVGANNINLGPSESGPVSDDSANGIVLASGSFPKLENFTDTKINDTAVSYKDTNNNMTINVSAVDNNNNITDIVSGLLNSGSYTSNQTIDQNGVTTYFLYKENVESYGADIYFSKDNQNYVISGTNITYENSDYFINNCKNIIDSMSSNGNSGGFSRW